MRPCSFRDINEEVRVICKKIIGKSSSGILTPHSKKGVDAEDQEVTKELCESCPVPEKVCQYLEFSLVKCYPGYLLSWMTKPKLTISHLACKKYTKKLTSIKECETCDSFLNT
jgi:hypothetical protein